MASNNNNDNSGMAMAFGIVVACAYAMVVFFFFIAMFVAFLLTIGCLFAWNRPRSFGRFTLMPADARSFVRRGLAGAFLLPAFLILLEVLFGLRINGDYLMHIVIGGYVLGSLGVEYLMAQMQEQTPTQQTFIPPSQQVAPPPQAQQPPAQPFRFASWNDEDGE